MVARRSRSGAALASTIALPNRYSTIVSMRQPMSFSTTTSLRATPSTGSAVYSSHPDRTPVMRDGSLVHDFLLRESTRQLHVANAPSPAATSALPIGDMIAERLVGVRTR